MISFLTSCNVILAEVSFKTCLRFLGRTVVSAIFDNGTTAVKNVVYILLVYTHSVILVIQAI